MGWEADEKEDKKCLYKHLPSGKRLEFVGDNENWLLEALQESAVEETVEGTMTGGDAAPPQMSGERRVENDEAPVDTDGEGVKTDEDWRRLEQEQTPCANRWTHQAKAVDQF